MSAITTLIKSMLEMNRQLSSRKRILNVKELSTYTGISISTIYKLTASCEIPYYKPHGKLIFFKKLEIDKWLLSRRIKTTDELYIENKNKQNEKFQTKRAFKA